MVLALLLIVLGGSGMRTAINQVDMIELNHKCSENECLQFDQVILWEWSPDYRRWNAHHWFLPRSLSEYPVKVGEFHQCTATTLDGKQFVFRSKMFRETWTFDDPERENIKVFPVEMRSRVFSCAR